MRKLSWIALVCILSAGLASCGGGGGGSGTSNASCESNTFWADDTRDSGLSIPDNNTAGIAVTWDNQTCTLRSVTSAAVEICLFHPDPADLVWTLTPPNAPDALPLTPPTNWNATGTACGDVGPTQGKLQRIELTPTTAISSARGNWTLHVHDERSGDTGTLVQWRVTVQGRN